MRLICKLSSPSCWISSLAASRKRCSRSATSRCRRSRVPIGCTSEEGANFEFNSKFDQALFPQQQCCKESIRTMPAREIDEILNSKFDKPLFPKHQSCKDSFRPLPDGPQSKKRRVNSGVPEVSRHCKMKQRI